MHLPVGCHLQAVLDAAKETIGGGQFARGIARHMAGAHQQPQRAERGWLAQSRIASAPDKLQRLRQEFDFANAALAELHVVAGDARNRVGFIGQCAAFVLIDPPLHGVDVGDCGEVQAAPPDEGADRLEETTRPAPGRRPPGAP